MDGSRSFCVVSNSVGDFVGVFGLKFAHESPKQGKIKKDRKPLKPLELKENPAPSRGTGFGTADGIRTRQKITAIR